MSALTAYRNTPSRDGSPFEGPVAATTEIFAGSLIARDSSGNLVPVTATTGLVGAGRAEEYVDNSTGAAADVNCAYKAGVFRWANGDTITKAHIGDTAYGFDDQTVKRVSTGLSPVGVIVDVDDDGVWVRTGEVIASTGLIAANNLSDVGTLATAQSNLGLTDGTLAARFEDVTVDDDCLVSGICTGLRKTQTVAASTYTVVSADDGDIVIAAAADNDVITLPDAAAANLGMRITVQNRGADGACKVSISPHSSDKIYGGIHGAATGDLVSFGEVADKDIINTKATAKKGDYAVLVSDGSTGWWVIGGKGVWASEA